MEREQEDPVLNRRGFLFRGAAASAAASTAALPAFSAEAVTPEDPVLLGLAGKLTEAEDALAFAHSRVRAARVPYDELRPAIPDELLPRRRLGLFGHPLYDAEGKHWTGDERLDVLTAEHLRFHAQDYGPRTKTGRVIKRCLPLADRFEAAILEAEERSGIREVVEGRRVAREALDTAAKAILDAPPARTMSGLEIKARALTTAGLMWDNGMSLLSVTYGAKFAAEVSAVARNGRQA